MIGSMNVHDVHDRHGEREQQRADDLAAIDRPDHIDDQRDDWGHVATAGSIGWRGSSSVALTPVRAFQREREAGGRAGAGSPAWHGVLGEPRAAAPRLREPLAVVGDLHLQLRGP